jgi:hypothetical protein
MATRSWLSRLNPADEGLRRVLHELGGGRWENIRRDLETYLSRNASRILEPACLRRAMRLAKVEKRPLADLCRARDPRLEFALYVAAYGILDQDASIASRDEYHEQNREIQTAIWTLGETLKREPTPDEVNERINRWIAESAAPQREKIVLIEQILMRSDWATYAPILWAELDRQAPSAPPSPVPPPPAPPVT